MEAGLDSAPMNLFDAPAGFDDPIGMWLGCHRRIEKQLGTLSKLPAHMDTGEATAVGVMALTLSLLATLYRSWRAARLDPVEALRYE